MSEAFGTLPWNRRQLREGFEQFGKGNRQPFLDLVSEDVKIILPLPSPIPWRGIHHGRDRLIDYLDRIGELLEFEQFELRDVFGAGERYAILLHERVLVKATGKRFEHDQIFLYRIVGGRIVEYQEFSDSDAMRIAFSPGVPAAE
jgi:uncharacterized protein